MDSIPRLQAECDPELVNKAIQVAILELGYSAATEDQDRAIKEFVRGKNYSNYCTITCSYSYVC